MKKVVIASIFFLLIPLLGFASYGNHGVTTNQRKGSWTFGGGFGMNFSDDNSHINISPKIGYNFNRVFTLGGGVSYSYHKYKNLDQKVNYLGLSLYGRVFPIQYITMFVEPGMQHRWGRIGDHKSKEGMFATALVGGGLAIPVGYGSRLIAEVYYDVLQNDYSPYGKNIGYSVGFSFSF